MISFRCARKETEWQLVVDVLSSTSADSTLTTRKPNSLYASLFPTNTSGFGFPTTIARMVCAFLVFGLPLCHAEVSTKRLFGMEVRGRAVNIPTTPSATLYYSITAPRILPTLVGNVPTSNRTIFLRPISRWQCYSTHSACPLIGLPKTICNIAGEVAVLCVLNDSTWSQSLITVFTVHACNVLQGVVLVKRRIEIDTMYFRWREKGWGTNRF